MTFKLLQCIFQKNIYSKVSKNSQDQYIYKVGHKCKEKCEIAV